MKVLEKIDWKVIITAIAGLTILEAIALLKGIDGVLLSVVIAVIAGLGGWAIPTPFKK